MPLRAPEVGIHLGPAGWASVHSCPTADAVRPATGRHHPPQQVRPETDHFFGKTLKLVTTVPDTLPRRLPGLRRLRRRPSPRALCPQPLRPRGITLAMVGAWLCVWLFAGPARGLVDAPLPADGAPATGGSVYQRAATADLPATPDVIDASTAVTAAAVSPVASVAAAPGPEESAIDQAGRAERVVAAAFGGLTRTPALSARVRQLVRVGDTVLKGTGRYIQSGVAEDQRYRYEYRLSAKTEEFEVLDICDGLFAWNYRRLGPHPPHVERIDVRRVRERLELLGIGHRKDQSAYLGGVQRDLALLRQYFRFVSITSAMIDDVPIWSIEGTWNLDALAWLLKDQAEAIKSEQGVGPQDIPEGMPWSVRLAISKRELFPCRIEWLAIPGRRPVPPQPTQVVGLLEFYDVRIGDPIDVSVFVYKPATEGLADITETYVPNVHPMRQ